ncbi:MAG: glycosyltransferase family 4 protein [Proteobacteria bacterium]|nr:glycosyltransferase family 4 protein [Pseudomonadota bacterium]
MSNKKVFLLQEIIPSYRVPVFRRLAELNDVDLTVFYSRPSKAMICENLKNSGEISGFNSIKIGLWELGPYTYQPGILWHVLIGRPDVMIAGQSERLDSLFLLLLCKLLGVRMLWFKGGVPYIDEVTIREHANRGRMNRWFGRYNPKRLLSLKADGVIAYSEHAKRYYTMMKGFPVEKIWVAPNSPDTDALNVYREEWLKRREELEADRKRFSPRGEKVLFLLGRLNKARKTDVLLRALQRLHAKGLDMSLVIVGDGSERKHLESMATHLGLDNVFFEGAIYNERELSKYFIIADVFITPGVASLAIKMAMAFGKPVVTVDYGLEVHDVQEGVNGFIFQMDNDEALAEKIQLLLQSNELIKRLGENGITTIRDRINIGRMVEGFRRAIFSER